MTLYSITTVAPHVPEDGVTEVRVREGESVVLQCPVAAKPGEYTTQERERGREIRTYDLWMK